MRILAISFIGKFLSLSLIFNLISGGFISGNVSAETSEINLENDASKGPRLDPGYGKFPILFEQNKGQADKGVKYLSRGGGYLLYLLEDGVNFSLRVPAEESTLESLKNHKTPLIGAEGLRMNFIGANSRPIIEASDEAITKTNYYKGKKRMENIANYGKVFYRGLYEGIDAAFYGNNGQLEYDFVVAPGAEAWRIGLSFEGAESLSLTETGGLLIKTRNTELLQKKPFAYQDIDGERREVAAEYELNGSRVSFRLGDYDNSKPLVIDPVVKYLTYLGGTALDDPFEVAVDAQGNAYVSGETLSLDFHGETRSADDDTGVFVAKINPDGSAFVYITILEGNRTDLGSGIAVNGNGEAFVVGQATRDFPVTSGAEDTNIGGSGDGFAAKLNAAGNLVYATYIGGGSGDDLSFDVAIDSGGKAYVTGRTASGLTFPQENRYQGCGAGLTFNSYDAYLTVVNASGSNFTYSTCIGGNLTSDQAFSIALDPSNNAYIVGDAEGGNFPTKNAFQPESGGGRDAFVAKFNPAASGEASLIYSTYLGGSGTEFADGVAVNSAGQAHVVGVTGSTNFPLLNPIRSINQINEAYVTILNSTGNSLVNSTFLGGSAQDEAINIALGPGGQIYVVGTTLSNDFPLSLPFQASRAGLRDVFVTKLKFGTGIMSSSYLGGAGNDFGDGIAVRGDLIFVVGGTESSNLTTTPGSIKQNSNASATNPDGFVAKILDTQADSVGIFRSPTTFLITQSISSVVSQTATFSTILAGARGVSGDWNGDGTDTIGSFTDGTWKVRDINFPIINVIPKTITFGQVGDLPVVGDWNGDGVDTPGVFRPSAGQFLLTNSTSTAPPAVDITINFGANGDLPIAGDWNADGIDSVGVFRAAESTFFLTDDNVLGATIDHVGFFGIAEDIPVAGDWNADGTDTIGIWRPSTREFILSNDNVAISASFVFGLTGGRPIVGDWNGLPD